MSLTHIKLLVPIASRLVRLQRRVKRALMLLADSIMIPVALMLAIAYRYGTFDSEMGKQWQMYVLAVMIFIPVLIRFGLYRAVVRFMGTKVVAVVCKSVLISVVLFAIASWLLLPYQPTLSVLATFVAYTIIYVGSSRLLVRWILKDKRLTGDRVAIYGAGDAGANLAMALFSGQKYTPVAFLDDNKSLHGSVINGIEVYAPEKVPELVENLGVNRVLLAVPTASRRRRVKIIEKLEKVPVHIQTMPNLADIIAGVTRVDELREIDVADLLGRNAVPPDESLLSSCLKGKTVMVTGAGGSIGSELCRQIVRQAPARLLLFESSELALYSINRELSGKSGAAFTNCELVALLGSIQDKTRIKEIMTQYKVHTVYHAAAYKHVPLVEQNIIAGVKNNVFGTLFCAEAAIESGVETFVLVSTDKAVCPTNVMGATKRLAEMVLQGLDEADAVTRFCMVRFGNVLASSGSVVPLFREQIQSGGPVTVTHPEIIRYFMTIPEAAQLTIQAGSIGTGGDVFLLDMGKPVRIEDLARRMIHLMGMTVMDEENPDGDIEIKYTGLRPAEKLYEELLIGNNVAGTEHPMIMRAEEKMLAWSELSDVLNQLRNAVNRGDIDVVIAILSNVVEEYTPSKQVVDHMWKDSESFGKSLRPKTKVSTLTSLRKA